MAEPLVTVVCVCYNHAAYLREAVISALQQTYRDVQVIIVDDGSTDDSPEIIRREFPTIAFLDLGFNHGYCAAFNKAIPMIRGEYVIDLSGDDILLPDRVREGVHVLDGTLCGVHFGDAELIGTSGNHLGFHSDRFPHERVPRGDIYLDLIQRYFICSPTMMFRKSILEALDGYDESLSYEDFDFWIRAARNHTFCYSPKVLVRKRLLPDSLGVHQAVLTHAHVMTTLNVCRKIMRLNRSWAEMRALRRRLFYEAGHAAKRYRFAWSLRFALLWLRTFFVSLNKTQAGGST